MAFLDTLIQQAKSWIKKYPWAYVRLHFQPLILLPDAPTFFEILGMTETGKGTLEVLHRRGLLAAVQHYFQDRLWLLVVLLPALIVVGITYLGCVVTTCRWLMQGQWYLLFLFLAFVVYYLVLPGPIVMPRYHLPALPLITVMAAGVLMEAVNRGRRCRPFDRAPIL